jgi:hypothetical protein
MTGLTEPQAESMESLWALAASPLELGVNLGDLTTQGLADLSNQAVIAVDQDGIDATRLANTSTEQVFDKTETNGDVIVGLFNTTGEPETISTTASAAFAESGSQFGISGAGADLRRRPGQATPYRTETVRRHRLSRPA